MLTVRVAAGGRDREFAVPAPPARLRVGTSPDADVRLTDPGVDPLHVEIEETPAGLRATDLGTSTGTRLNGLLISQALLKAGDELRVGSVRMTVVAADVTEAPPAAATPPAAKTRDPQRPASRPKNAPARKAARRDEVKTHAPVDAPRRSAGARRAKKKSPVVPLAVAGVVAAVLVAILLASSGKEESLREARAKLDEAVSARDAGDFDVAEKGFRAVMDGWPSSPQSGEAERLLGGLAVLREKRAEAERAAKKREEDASEALTVLRERWTELTAEAFKAAHERFRERFEGTAAAADEAFLPSVLADYDAEKGRRFERVRSRIATLLEAERYYDARFVLVEYLYLPTNVEPDQAAAEREDKRVRKVTRGAYEDLDARAKALMDSGKVEEAAKLLLRHRESFRGTRYFISLRQRLDLAQILRADEEIAPEEAIAKAGKRELHLRAAEDAESLARGRRFREAAAAFRVAAEECPFADLAAEFRARADQLGQTAELFAALRRQVKESPGRFKGIELGNGLKGNVVGANEDSISIQLGAATSKLAWDRMGAASMVSLLARLDLDAAGRLSLARFAFESGEEQAGHDAITAALKADRALEADPNLEADAFRVLAEARGIPVPEGGFTAYRGRWLTPDERKNAELLDRIAEAERAARSSDARRREAALATLRELGDPAKETLVRVLVALREKAVEGLLAHPSLRDSGTKNWLASEIEKRRKAALVLIFDTVKYPYPHPDGPAYDAVQKEVDTLVDAVRQVWYRPLEMLLERHEELKDLHARLGVMSEELVGLGHKSGESFADLVKRVNEGVDLRHFAGGGVSKGDIEWNDKCLEYNRLIDIGLDDEEKACVEELNEYRMMMGRKAVKWNDKLLKASRGHSKEMKEKNFFAHNVPLPGAEFDDHRTPNQRAKNAGYGGGVSENIARGSTKGRDTHWQWYRSSGHHRNLLGKGHTEVGLGRFEEFWTQNFGRAGRSLELPRKEGTR